MSSVIFSLSQQGYNDQIALLQAQINSLPEGDAERGYLNGILAIFEIEKAILQAHPELDPTTRSGAEALQKLFKQDGDLQSIQNGTTFCLLLAIWLYLRGLLESSNTPPTSWSFTSVGLLQKPGDVTVIRE